MGLNITRPQRIKVRHELLDSYTVLADHLLQAQDRVIVVAAVGVLQLVLIGLRVVNLLGGLHCSGHIKYLELPLPTDNALLVITV